MLDELENLYALMRKYTPELADQADTLLSAEKEKFIKSVEPAIKQFVEKRTRNVSDIKSSFNDKINEQPSKVVRKAVPKRNVLMDWREREKRNKSASYYGTNVSVVPGKTKGEGWGWVSYPIVFIGGVFLTRWLFGAGKNQKSYT